jgi:hypothetical protein
MLLPGLETLLAVLVALLEVLPVDLAVLLAMRRVAGRQARLVAQRLRRLHSLRPLVAHQPLILVAAFLHPPPCPL